ncbi:MAG: hypothetical protein KF708_10405 [Pirellulales bacterium]|nr:hypothetical protein [Pirellulales bacterium]
MISQNFDRMAPHAATLSIQVACRQADSPPGTCLAEFGVSVDSVFNMPRKKKPSVEARIVAGLQSVADALEKGERLEDRFNCRTVRLNIESVAYTPDRVKSVRDMLGLSQALFAQFPGRINQQCSGVGAR